MIDTDFETIELTFQCKDCSYSWVEYHEFVCDSECDSCGKEHIKASKVRDLL